MIKATIFLSLFVCLFVFLPFHISEYAEALRYIKWSPDLTCTLQNSGRAKSETEQLHAEEFILCFQICVKIAEKIFKIKRIYFIFTI